MERTFGRALTANDMAALMDVAWMGHTPFTSASDAGWRNALHALHADSTNGAAAAEAVIH